MHKAEGQEECMWEVKNTQTPKVNMDLNVTSYFKASKNNVHPIWSQSSNLIVDSLLQCCTTLP